MKNWAFKQLVVWGGLALLMALIVPRLTPQSEPMRANPVIAAVPPAAAPQQPQRQDWPANALVFPAAADGHVYIDALVNGVPVHFLVDTGATLVSLTMKDAKAAGIAANGLNYTVRTTTANGISEAAPVTLHEMRIGQMPLYDVNALVHRNLGISLLGQSFLTRLHSYNMENGQLRLDWN
jgi:aspartyl protease family protein